jgi:hypothetical protein
MRAVKAAEKTLWETETTKTYTGLAGEPAYNAAMVGLILGAGYADRAASGGHPGRHRRDPAGAGTDPHGLSGCQGLDVESDLAEPPVDREIPWHAGRRISLFRCGDLAASISPE